MRSKVFHRTSEFKKLLLTNKKMNFHKIITIIIISILPLKTIKTGNLIISITTLIPLITSEVALGLTESEINRIAGEITVRIDGPNRGGSGVIVEKQGNTYYIGRISLEKRDLDC
ncbi:MAG: hypothetical protein F6K39_21170, partial [Okeania sp. SIO3B3]|nr:hypothetical protein [Okeania sp. SIO3B3]